MILDKTSGSLFKSNIDPKRQKELPNKMSALLTIDEFCEQTTSGNSGESFCEVSPRDDSSQENWPPKRLHSRSHFKPVKVDKLSVYSDSVIPQGRSVTTVSNETKRKRQRLQDKELIAEMNRQYDHNICLDRFINDMEKQHEVNMTETFNDGTQDITTRITNENSSRVNSTHHMETCSNCSKGSGSCPWCTSGSSSAAPQSNETDSNGSRKSESIKSSTPENGSSDKPVSKENNQSRNISNHGSDKVQHMFETLTELNTESISAKETENENEVNMDSNYSTDKNIDDQNKAKKYKGGKLGRKRKREYIYNPKPVKEKRSKETVPEQCKDTSYWEKRIRNNEAARKSRELRRKKELETRDKYHRLLKENEALRVAIALLVKRNETIDQILAEYAKSEKKDMFLQELPPISG